MFAVEGGPILVQHPVHARTFTHACIHMRACKYTNRLAHNILLHSKHTFAYLSNVRGNDIFVYVSFPRTLRKQPKVRFSEKRAPFSFFFQKRSPMSPSSFFAIRWKKPHRNRSTISRVIKGQTNKHTYITLLLRCIDEENLQIRFRPKVLNARREVVF